jgi:hypothetical protein
MDFHVKMSQFFKVTIKSCILIGKLLENLSEKHYFYNFTLVDGENRIESEDSADFENCFLHMSMHETAIQKNSDSNSNRSQEADKKSNPGAPNILLTDPMDSPYRVSEKDHGLPIESMKFERLSSKCESMNGSMEEVHLAIHRQNMGQLQGPSEGE